MMLAPLHLINTQKHGVIPSTKPSFPKHLVRLLTGAEPTAEPLV